MGSSQQKLVEKTTMNLLIATALAVLGIAAAEPGYRYGGYGGYGGYRGYGGYGHYLVRGLLTLRLSLDMVMGAMEAMVDIEAMVDMEVMDTMVRFIVVTKQEFCCSIKLKEISNW